MKTPWYSRRFKRAVDFSIAGLGVVVLSPVLCLAALLILLEDRANPIYASRRIGLNGTPFTMLKFRTMRVNADQFGPSSTASTDARITRVGRVLRKAKFDELPQLVNVARGEMSLVGPRPQLEWAVEDYTTVEQALLSVRPGITDLASVVFADEGEILAPHNDPDLAYEQLVRPGKSKLGIHYVHHCSLRVDIWIVFATVLNSVNRQRALAIINRILRNTGADKALIDLAVRTQELVPCPPPGAAEVVTRIRRPQG